MSRPLKKRRVCASPICTRFVPEGDMGQPPVQISLEEYECVRLMDYEGMTQEECARQMGVPGFHLTGGGTLTQLICRNQTSPSSRRFSFFFQYRE